MKQKDQKESIETNKINKSRRAVVKGAAGVAPVLLTVANRPVWANFCNHSGQLSGNLSNPQHECGGEGCSPGHFKRYTSMWHHEYPPEALYDTAFGFGPGGSPFPGMTLYEVITLHEGGYDPSAIAFPSGCTSTGCKKLVVALGVQSVAALQNAATDVSYSYTVDDVILMTRQAFNSGDKATIENLKNIFDTENNLGCPF